jgi:hypothetical protein
MPSSRTHTCPKDDLPESWSPPGSASTVGLVSGFFKPLPTEQQVAEGVITMQTPL